MSLNTCTTLIKKNMGISRCNKLPGKIVSMITTPESFEIDADTLVDQELLFVALNEAILEGQATRIYKWPDFVNMEQINKEAAYEDTAYSYLPIDDGQYRWKPSIRENLCIHRAMYTHRANSGRIIAVDHLNQLFLTEKSNGAAAGFRIQTLNTEKLLLNDGSVSTKSPIVIALKNNLEIDKTGLLATLDSVGELYRIVDVAIEVVTVLAQQIVVIVTAECDGTGIEGLAHADFILKDAAGAVQTINGFSEQGDGQYTLAKTSGSWVDGTLELKPPSTLSLTPYELPEPVDIDIPS